MMTLPHVSCAVKMTQADGGAEPAHVHMTLDTVMLDLQDENAEHHTATPIWRAQILASHRFIVGDIISVGIED